MISRTRFDPILQSRKERSSGSACLGHSTVIGVLFASVDVCPETRVGFTKCAKLTQMLDFKTFRVYVYP